MYPFARMAKELYLARRQPRLEPGEEHVSWHICWPHDLDFWLELNNGRTLTIMDLGRVPMAARYGLIDALRRRRWGLTVAGSMVRYRRRIRVFDRVRLHSKAIGSDDKFLYIEQAIWRMDGECATNAVFRTAVTDNNGIVSPKDVLKEIGQPEDALELPDWVKSWIDTEAQRPWPPVTGANPPVA